MSVVRWLAASVGVWGALTSGALAARPTASKKILRITLKSPVSIDHVLYFQDGKGIRDILHVNLAKPYCKLNVGRIPRLTEGTSFVGPAVEKLKFSPSPATLDARREVPDFIKITIDCERVTKEDQLRDVFRSIAQVELVETQKALAVPARPAPNAGEAGNVDASGSGAAEPSDNSGSGTADGGY